MISQYNVARMPAGPRNIMFAVGKSIRLEGFIVSNHFNLLPEFQKDMSGWIREGKLTWKETVEGNRRAWHRECADRLSQIVQGREFGKDAGEAGLKHRGRPPTPHLRSPG
jgi:NADPH-dependent curcumin reductase CurA